MKNWKFNILFLLIPFSLFGEEVFDLQECLEIGLERNYAIRIIRNEQQVADNNYTVGNAGYLPSIDLNAGYSGALNNTTQHLSNGNTNQEKNALNQRLSAAVNLDWTLFDGLQIQAKHAKLRELRDKGELYTRLTIEDFIAEFTAEYYNNVRQNIRLNNLKYAVSLSKERLRIIEARHGIGSVSRLELQQARVDFNADSSNLIKQYEVVYTSKIRLNQLMALDEITYPVKLTDSVIEYNRFLDREDIWEKTLNTNSTLLLAEKDKIISELDYKAVKSRNYPYLKLNAGYGINQDYYNKGQYEKQWNHGLNYGLTLGFNIFSGMERKREQNNAKLYIQNQELQYKQLELALKAEFSNIWMAYVNNLGLDNLEKENLQTAKENYEIAIERYKLGDLSGIELREAQNSLLEAEDRFLQSQYNTKLCEISLLQISGQVTEYLAK